MARDGCHRRCDRDGVHRHHALVWRPAELALGPRRIRGSSRWRRLHAVAPRLLAFASLRVDGDRPWRAPRRRSGGAVGQRQWRSRFEGVPQRQRHPRFVLLQDVDRPRRRVDPHYLFRALRRHGGPRCALGRHHGPRHREVRLLREAHRRLAAAHGPPHELRVRRARHRDRRGLRVRRARRRRPLQLRGGIIFLEQGVDVAVLRRQHDCGRAGQSGERRIHRSAPVWLHRVPGP
mmetsp:Transcript_93683/g.269799  ORF Transcript_93683/g.269799 Transcript_93683/m.269799 type:complete len:234 (-) Transcript_93683:1544-2245(-)